MFQRSVQVRQMVQGGRAENQVEPVEIREVHQIADLILNVLTRSTRQVNQRLTDVDTNHLIESLRQDDRVATRPTSSIQCSASVRRQLRQQPVQQRSWREACGPIVFLGAAIER